MGRGRTTTGMVIATLIYINRIGASGGDFLLLFNSLFFTLILEALISLSYTRYFEKKKKSSVSEKSLVHQLSLKLRT